MLVAPHQGASSCPPFFWHDGHDGLGLILKELHLVVGRWNSHGRCPGEGHCGGLGGAARVACPPPAASLLRCSDPGALPLPAACVDRPVLILSLQFGVTAIDDLPHLVETDFLQLGSGLKLRCLRAEISKLCTRSPRVSPRVSPLASAVPVSHSLLLVSQLLLLLCCLAQHTRRAPTRD